MNKKIKIIGTVAILLVWAITTACAWFAPPKPYSDTERSELAQMPEVTWKTLWDGTFMPKFEEFTLDQFPGRDAVRTVKAVFHYYVLNQSDNNGFYLADGTIGKVEYPMNQASVNYAVKRLQYLYDTYVADTQCKAYLSLVPDKGYYMAQENGYPAMDYEKMFETIRQALPQAHYVDITVALNEGDYYRTDTHWRQECIVDVAAHLGLAMGVELKGEYRENELDKPFYGVYCGQAALPLPPETLYYLTNDILDGCSVYDLETDKYMGIYDLAKAEGQDPYEIFLSGSKSLLTIENSACDNGKELIVFRDSFGSSIVPLLIEGYSTVTVVDIRYMSTDVLGRFVDFHGQDVLFLYSTLVLNNSVTLK